MVSRGRTVRNAGTAAKHALQTLTRQFLRCYAKLNQWRLRVSVGILIPKQTIIFNQMRVTISYVDSYS